jgi:hypothetical protein
MGSAQLHARRWLPAGAVLLGLALAAPVRGGDARHDLVLTWTAVADATGGTALEYDLRVSDRTPGADRDAWFADAASHPVTGPSLPGDRERVRLSGVAQGPVYAALRVRGAGGWSAVSEPAAFTPDEDPFLVGVEPQVLLPGAATVLLEGAGLSPDAVVRLVGDKASVDAGTVAATANGLRAEFDVPAVLGDYTIEVIAPEGTDRLDGWVEVRDQPVAAPELPYPVSDLAVSGSGNGVALAWTAPADRSGGRIGSYEIRRAEVPAGSFVWQRATSILPPTIPGDPGSRETWSVDGVAEGEVASFAVVSRDTEGRVSAVSNVVEIDRRNPPAPGEGYLAVLSRDGAYTFTVEPPGAAAAVEPVIRVHDVLGREIARPEVAVAGGAWAAEWTGEDRRGRRVAPGVYFVHVVHGAGAEAAKLLVVR